MKLLRIAAAAGGYVLAVALFWIYTGDDSEMFRYGFDRGRRKGRAEARDELLVMR